MEKALELVEQLATKLGVAAEYLVTVLVKQQYAEGITSLIIAAINLLVVIAMLIFIPRLTVKIHNEYLKIWTDREKNGTGFNGSCYVSSFTEDFYCAMRFVIPIVAVIIGIVLLSIITNGITTGVQQLINPDYFAFKEILDVISAG